MSEAGELFLVPTPIGNYADISRRAVETLAAVDIVAAEDTRVTIKLLRHLEVRAKKLVSYHDHNEAQRAPWLVQQLLGGANVALVSDAGTPLQSDPGFQLVRLAVQSNITVRSLPGPSAVPTALAGSGLSVDRYCFLGFLPRKPGRRKAVLRRYVDEPSTLVLFEAPHRLLETLLALREVLGDREAAIGWNLTKDKEAFLRGTLAALHAQLASWEYVHGEITLCVAGVEEREGEGEGVDPGALIRALIEHGVDDKITRDVVAGLTKAPKREIYTRILQVRAELDE